MTQVVGENGASLCFSLFQNELLGVGNCCLTFCQQVQVLHLVKKTQIFW